MTALRAFNMKNIYMHPRLDAFRGYARLIIRSLYSTLMKFYAKGATPEVLKKNIETYPVLAATFHEWLLKYGVPNERDSVQNRYENRILYDLNNEKDYLRAVVDFISGMTDLFAIRVFTETTRF